MPYHFMKNTELYIAAVARIDKLGVIINNKKPQNGKFGLLILNHSTLSRELWEKTATQLINRGLGLLCVRGEDSQNIENIFDGIIVEKYLNEKGFDIGIPTTVHDTESLEDTINFFLIFGSTGEYSHKFIILIDGDLERNCASLSEIESIVNLRKK